MRRLPDGYKHLPRNWLLVSLERLHTNELETLIGEAAAWGFAPPADRKNNSIRINWLRTCREQALELILSSGGTGHFNQLTPAEAERLAMLAVECGEIIQIVGKTLRHGYGSYHPDRPEITNRTLLERELTDLRAVLSLMADDFGSDPFGEPLQSAVTRKLRHAHHQDENREGETG